MAVLSHINLDAFACNGICFYYFLCYNFIVSLEICLSTTKKSIIYEWIMLFGQLYGKFYPIVQILYSEYFKASV